MESVSTDHLWYQKLLYQVYDLAISDKSYIVYHVCDTAKSHMTFCDIYGYWSNSKTFILTHLLYTVIYITYCVYNED